MSSRLTFTPCTHTALATALVLAGAFLAGCEDSSEESLSVVAFGDWGTGDADQQSVADALATYCKNEGCDMGWLLGDNFYPAGVTSVDDPQWDAKFVDMYRGLDIPFYAVLGNHDYGSGQEGAMSQVAYSDVNPDWVMPNIFNVFQTDQALVLALDTTLIGLGDPDATEGQAAVFANALGRSDAPWRIAFGHHPYLSDGIHGNAGSYDGVTGNGNLVKAFFDQVLCGKVDLLLAGHDHNLQVLKGPGDCPGTFVVAGGGGAPRYELPARDGNTSKFSESALGFAHLVMKRKSIRVRLVDEHAKVLYETTLKK